MRKPAFCICENKEAVQRLCFRYIASAIPLLPKSEISSLLPSSVTAQPGFFFGPGQNPRRPVFSHKTYVYHWENYKLRDGLLYRETTINGEKIEQLDRVEQTLMKDKQKQPESTRVEIPRHV